MVAMMLLCNAALVVAPPTKTVYCLGIQISILLILSTVFVYFYSNPREDLSQWQRPEHELVRPREKPATPSDGFVHYKTTPYNGWNNQRQCAMMAWMVAYFTGHTLELKPFHPAETMVLPDKGGYVHGDLWNLSFLEKYVHVQYIPSSKTSEGYDYKINKESVFADQSAVRALKSYDSISYDQGSANIDRAFPWLDPSQEVFFHLMDSFSYNSQIQRVADQLVDRIGRPFLGLHIRVGRVPALNCSALGVDVITETGGRYHRGSCGGIDWDNVVDAVFPNLEENYTIYIAHDSNTKRSATRSGQNILQSLDFDFVHQLRPAVISAVEQEVLIRAKYFIPSMYSSWSEYVVYKRLIMGKKDGMHNYEVWKEKNVIFYAPK